MQAHPTAPSGPAPPPDDEFLARFGDAIDDRVAEVVEDLVGPPRARPHQRWLRPVLAVAALVLATVATMLLRRDAVAVATIWPSAAVIYLAAIRRTGAGRP